MVHPGWVANVTAIRYIREMDQKTKRQKPSARDAGAYAAVVKSFENDPRVTLPGTGKGFGSGALKVGGKIFAMLSSKSEFVVKLSEARAAELVTSSLGKYFDPGRGKLMKSWVVVTAGERWWIPLANEARAFAE
jgi:hypothetical protein